VERARADLGNARAAQAVARAQTAKGQVSVVDTQRDLGRKRDLRIKGFIAQADEDAAQAVYDSALAQHDANKAQEQAQEAGVRSAEAALKVTEAQLLSARAQVGQNEAGLRQTQLDLEHTIIRAPVDGVVVSRTVDVGQTVAASLQAPTLFTIAQDLTKMQVHAKTDESDVGSIEAGRPVAFKVDAFPKETFHGLVSQVRMNATVVQNVVTYDTIVDFDNRDLKLFPGMTAYATIPIATVENTLKVPNAALRYKPPLTIDEIRELYRKYGIDESPAQAAPAAPPSAQGTMGAPRQADASQPSPRKEPPGATAVVWRLRAKGALEPVQVGLGITDHSFTELAAVVRGQLQEGDEIITGSVGGGTPGGPALPGGVRR
jgi:HlyD family secretion protein